MIVMLTFILLISTYTAKWKSTALPYARTRKYKATYKVMSFLAGAYLEPVYFLAIESAKTLKLGLDEPAIN